MSESEDKKDALSINEGHVEVNLFNDIEIRRVFHNGEWWFAVMDVVGAVTGSPDPSKYLSNMRRRDDGLSAVWGRIVEALQIKTTGGMQSVNCANAQGIFRIIQSVSAPGAEPLKLWIARIAYERLQEIDDPEIAIKRAIIHYQDQGRSEEWINARLKSIQTRKELCDEWGQRGIAGSEFGILTGIVAKQSFGVTPTEHKEIKGLGRSHNLRDHMTDIELILTMLGEKSTANIAIKRNAQGLEENKIAANAGGKIAGNARRGLELELGEKVVSRSNFLPKGKKALGN